MEDWLLMQTFYHGLTTSAHENIDATAEGSFLSLTIHEATTLVKKIASNQGWNKEHTQPRKEEKCIKSKRWICCLPRWTSS
jgi:hypothetical protein